ncbi:MAG: diaminopimelate decarboxylase, partial [Ardenticatenaceae bacterium]
MQKTEQDNRVQKLVSLLGSEGTSEFTVGSASVSSLAERFGTPFYVYSGDVILRQINRLRNALGDDTDIYFSLKANPSLGVCQLIAAQGLGAEVASVGELLLSQKAGFPAEKTIFAGPGKTNEELELATRLGIFSVNVESEGEMARLGEIASRAGKVLGAGIRINPAFQVKGAQMRMGGGPQQFGIDAERVEQAIARFSENPYLRILGPHVFVGTQMFDVEAIASHFRHVVELAQM